MLTDNPALAMLRHHVTGAVERGEAHPIAAVEATDESAWRAIEGTAITVNAYDDSKRVLGAYFVHPDSYTHGTPQYHGPKGVKRDNPHKLGYRPDLPTFGFTESQLQTVTKHDRNIYAARPLDLFDFPEHETDIGHKVWERCTRLGFSGFSSRNAAARAWRTIQEKAHIFAFRLSSVSRPSN